MCLLGGRHGSEEAASRSPGVEGGGAVGSGLGPGFQGRDGSGVAPARLASLGFLGGRAYRSLLSP